MGSLMRLRSHFKFFALIVGTLIFATGCPSWFGRGGLNDQAMSRDRAESMGLYSQGRCPLGYKWGPPPTCQGDDCNKVGCYPAYNMP